MSQQSASTNPESQIPNPGSKDIVLAFSGGLDTSFCVPYLQERGWNVHTVFADTGGVDAEEGRSLNREFRAKDYATNVLTFDYAHEPVVAADLVICAEVVEREAREMGLDLAAHYAHMLVHGMLHAQGYDHEEDDEARVMEARETEVLAGLGFADPYR